MESLDWRDTDSTRCSVARTAAVVGDGWTVLLLRDLFNGLRRFDELAVHLGVARNVLTRRLAALTEEPDVRPASLRNWAGRRLYEAGMPIEHVARRMGSRSLDSVASDIALDWRPS